jgi:glutamate synthase (NADPH/NADH) small chain
MGKVTGFMEEERRTPPRRPVEERVLDYLEVYNDPSESEIRAQAARCMDCGVPFCHQGCPLGNIIPDFNDLVYRNKWKEALDRLHRTNNFPEFTGRICPAPCESACVLSINDEPVTIEFIEKTIADRGFSEGWLVPRPPSRRTDKRVAVVGSGPAGLAAADELNRAGHHVTVFEKQDRFGGLLRYGIPDFKLEKWVIDRRLEVMEAEGVEFRARVHIGVTMPAAKLLEDYDAVVIAAGAEAPRDLRVPGRELDGVHFAMPFLEQQNRRVAADPIADDKGIVATDRTTVVLGGGDTGSDCTRSRRRGGPSRRPGPSTRCPRRSCAARARTRKGVSATGASRPPLSAARTARSRSCTRCASASASPIPSPGGVRSSPSRARSSPSTSTWCFWRSASSVRFARGCWSSSTSS